MVGQRIGRRGACWGRHWARGFAIRVVAVRTASDAVPRRRMWAWGTRGPLLPFLPREKSCVVRVGHDICLVGSHVGLETIAQLVYSARIVEVETVRSSNELRLAEAGHSLGEGRHSVKKRSW